MAGATPLLGLQVVSNTKMLAINSNWQLDFEIVTNY